ADLLSSGAGDPTARGRALRALLEAKDARVRAAAFGVLAKIFIKERSQRSTAISTLVAALAPPDVIIAGSAVDAVGEILDAIKTRDPNADRDQLEAALVARAKTEKDIELGASLFELVGKHAIAIGVEACRGALHDHPVRARAAAACL